MREDGRKLFSQALLASLLLHLGFLAVLPLRLETRRQPPAPIVARLARLEHPDARVAPAPEIARPPQGRTASTSSPSRAKRNPSGPGALPEARVPSPQPSAESVAGPPAASVAAPAPPADAIGTLARYRLAVMARARGLNRYPALALENGWQGRSDLRLRIAADGRVEAVEVIAGSGHEALDLGAIDMIAQAAREVPIPEALSGREFAIEIPVIFALRETAR